jgi:hypothetical protein
MNVDNRVISNVVNAADNGLLVHNDSTRDLLIDFNVQQGFLLIDFNFIFYGH